MSDRPGKNNYDKTLRESTAPLSDLSEKINRQKQEPGQKVENPLEEFDDPTGDGPWEKLDATVSNIKKSDRSLTQSMVSPSTKSRTIFGSKRLNPDNPSRNVLKKHGALTAATLILAVLIYLFAAIGIMPKHYWLVSLPLLTLGLFGLVPILAWILGLWNPRTVG